MDGAYLVTKNNKIKEKLYNYLNNFLKMMTTIHDLFRIQCYGDKNSVLLK